MICLHAAGIYSGMYGTDQCGQSVATKITVLGASMVSAGANLDLFCFACKALRRLVVELCCRCAVRKDAACEKEA